jgi:hypothetical protein
MERQISKKIIKKYGKLAGRYLIAKKAKEKSREMMKNGVVRLAFS